MSAMMDRVRMMVSRAIVALVDDAPKVQELQVSLLADEAQDGVERVQNYGLTSVPLPGAEAVAVCAGGLRSHMLVIAVDDRRYRLTGMEGGEVALYDDLGQMVKLGRDYIEIFSDSEIRVAAPIVLVTAEDVTIESGAVALGGSGGQAVARVGDSVDLGTGLILTGSDVVSAT